MGLSGWTIGYLAVGVAAFLALLAGIAGPHWLCSPERGHPAQAGTALRDAAVCKTPSPDIHLVMNVLNRLAAEPAVEEAGHDQQIYELSDYLRQCLAHTRPVRIGLREELALLDSYVRLVAAFRGWKLEMPAALGFDTPGPLVHAHSTCLIAQALFCGFSADTPGRWALPVNISGGQGQRVDIDMALRALSPQSPARLHSIHDEMQTLCRTMSGQTIRWDYSLACHGDADIAVKVHIDGLEHPMPAALRLA